MEEKMGKTIHELLHEPCGVITAKKQLAPLIYELTIYAPAVVHNAEPGQFVIVYARDEKSKPIPLTIADSDKELGTITLVVQAVKAGTMKLLTMDVGETFYSLQGPLGHPSEIKKYDGTIVCVAGGVGIAPMYPVVRALKEAGNKILVVLGAREERFLFWEEKIRPYADWTTVCIEKEPVACNRTPGFVTPYLEYYLERNLDSVSHVIAAGPLGMLNAISKITKPRGVEFVASAVSHMLDGTGMCGGCQCNVGSDTILLCQKGPEIDGNLADWDTLGARLNGLRKKEDEYLAEFKANDPLYQKFLAQEAAFKGGAE
jgi:ferredoxin--NADP+ reductase